MLTNIIVFLVGAHLGAKYPQYATLIVDKAVALAKAAWAKVTGLHGATGTTGSQDIDGASGADGYQGSTDAQGIDSTSGAQGIDGASGVTGIDDASGATGLVAKK